MNKSCDELSGGFVEALPPPTLPSRVLSYVVRLALIMFGLLVLSCGKQAESTSDIVRKADLPGHIQPTGLKGCMFLFDIDETNSPSIVVAYPWSESSAADIVSRSTGLRIRPSQCVAGDTNVAVFTQNSSDSTYLIAVRFHERKVVDTLFGGAIGDGTNPIPFECDIVCSMRDSLFYFDDWRKPGRRGSVIWKLNSDRTWIQFKILPALLSYAISYDFTEMYFCTDSSGLPDLPYGCLFVLDLASDSLIRITELGDGIKQAGRISKDWPIFLVKIWGNDTNIWTFLPGKGANRITDILPPRYVRKFEISGNELIYQTGPSNEHGYYQSHSLPLLPVEDWKQDS